MTINIEELRRLAQEAMHPVTKGRWMRLFGERTVYDRMEDGCRGIPVVSTPVSPPHPFEAACLDFIAAANPAAVIELLDRLEAAESEAIEQARLNGMGSEREAALMAKLEVAEKTNRGWLRANATGGWIDNLRIENDTLRAKIDQLEEDTRAVILADNSGAQPAPIEQDTSVRKAWARFSNELHRSPNAPYPGMSEAFEQHFSQSFTDREWRAESATWAAAWKAAKRHEAQAQPAPSVPDDIVREVLRDCCGTFHGSRHRITCEKYKGKREPGDKP